VLKPGYKKAISEPRDIAGEVKKDLETGDGNDDLPRKFVPVAFSGPSRTEGVSKLELLLFLYFFMFSASNGIGYLIDFHGTWYLMSQVSFIAFNGLYQNENFLSLAVPLRGPTFRKFSKDLRKYILIPGLSTALQKEKEEKERERKGIIENITTGCHSNRFRGDKGSVATRRKTNRCKKRSVSRCLRVFQEV
jgi:hypothetical protein